MNNSNNDDGNKDRLKDISAKNRHIYNGLSPEMKSFWDEYYQLRGKFPTFTSGKREAGQKVGKSHKVSHHNTGDAVDFSASDYEEYNFLMNSQEGLTLLDKYKLGIIDETDPEMIKKTGATRAHFHLGRDSKYYAKVQERLQMYGQEAFTPIYSYKQRYEMGEDPSTIIADKDGHDHSHDTEQIPPFEIKQYEDVFTRVAEKEMVKEAKEASNNDRKAIKEEISKEEAFMQEFLKDESSNVAQQQYMNNKGINEEVEPTRINVDLQQGLSQLPNLYTT